MLGSLAVAGLLTLRIEWGARFNAAMVIIKIAAVVLVIAAGLPHVHTANWHPFMPYGFGGVVEGAAVVFFLTAIILWAMSALRNVQRLQRRNAAFVGSALNSMSQGIVIVDPHGRLAFCNDSYLDMYGLSRSDLSPRMTGRQLAELRDAIRSPSVKVSGRTWKASGV